MPDLMEFSTLSSSNHAEQVQYFGFSLKNGYDLQVFDPHEDQTYDSSYSEAYERQTLSPKQRSF